MSKDLLFIRNVDKTTLKTFKVLCAMEEKEMKEMFSKLVVNYISEKKIKLPDLGVE